MAEGKNENVAVNLGHSNRTNREFLGLLDAWNVGTLIDLRSVPKSPRFPHFSKDPLDESLDEEGVDYEHWPELGGYREPTGDSENMALSEGFQAVADHLNSPNGQDALDRLEDKVQQSPNRLALMCAEKDPQQCHRTLISDHLTARNLTIRHLIDRADNHSHGRRRCLSAVGLADLRE